MRYAAVFALTATLLAACGPMETKPENKAPTVTLTPAAAQSVVKDVPATKLTANATDDGTIAKVEFLDGTTVAATDSTAPYEFTPPTATVGEKTYIAKAYDDKGLTGVSAGVKVTVTPPVVVPTGRVRLVHAVSDAPNVDVQVDNTAVGALNNVAFGTFSPYLSVPAKATNVKVFATTTTTNPVLNVDATIAANTDYTAIAVGKLTPVAPATTGTVTALLLQDNNTAPAAGKVKVRVIHAASTVPAVDVYASAVSAAPAAPALFPNLTFNNTAVGAYPYKEVDPGTYKISVFAKDANPATAVAALTVNTPALEAGKIYTAIALDPKAPATAPTVVFLTDN